MKLINEILKTLTPVLQTLAQPPGAEPGILELPGLCHVSEMTVIAIPPDKLQHPQRPSLLRIIQSC